MPAGTLGAIYSEPWQVQLDFIATALAAAVLPGGALDFLAAVDEVSPPASEVQPVLGYQWRRSGDQLIGQNRIAQSGLFEFTLVIVRDFDPSITDAARETKLRAEKAWNDRKGRGLGPFLRSIPTLGGTCTTAYISSHMVTIGRGVVDQNFTSAVVYATLTTDDQSFPTFH